MFACRLCISMQLLEVARGGHQITRAGVTDAFDPPAYGC